MTDHETKVLNLLREWQALDDMTLAQSAAVQKSTAARDSKWAELLYEVRKRGTDVLR